MKVKLQLPTSNTIIQNKGFAPDGAVQKFHTQNVLKRIKKYMPFTTGAMYAMTVAQTDINRPEIVINAPQAQYLYRGKKMIDPKINASGFLTPEGWRSRRGSVKVLTGENLKYNRSKNAAAGPLWDRALVAAEGEILVSELQQYIDRR